jgi:hypothetical protein
MQRFVNFSAKISGSTFTPDVVEYMFVRMNFRKFPVLLIQTWGSAGLLDVKLY